MLWNNFEKSTYEKLPWVISGENARQTELSALHMIISVYFNSVLKGRGDIYVPRPIIRK